MCCTYLPKNDLFLLIILASQTFYPNWPFFLHGYIRHIRDIFQLWLWSLISTIVSMVVVLAWMVTTFLMSTISVVLKEERASLFLIISRWISLSFPNDYQTCGCGNVQLDLLPGWKTCCIVHTWRKASLRVVSHLPREIPVRSFSTVGA